MSWRRSTVFNKTELISMSLNIIITSWWEQMFPLISPVTTPSTPPTSFFTTFLWHHSPHSVLESQPVLGVTKRALQVVSRIPGTVWGPIFPLESDLSRGNLSPPLLKFLSVPRKDVKSPTKPNKPQSVPTFHPAAGHRIWLEICWSKVQLLSLVSSETNIIPGCP